MNAAEARRVQAEAIQRVDAYQKKLRDAQHLARMSTIFLKVKEAADKCKDSTAICVNDSDEIDRIVGELGVYGYIVSIEDRPGEAEEYTNDGEALPGAPYQVYVIAWKEGVKDAYYS